LDFIEQHIEFNLCLGRTNYNFITHIYALTLSQIFLVMKRILLLVSLLYIYQISIAQLRYYPENNIQFTVAGRPLTLANCGGFNNPQFAMADLNRDGLKDLVVFENGKGIRTFLNKGTTAAPDYRFYPQYALNFPPIYQYLVLADYNCDNIPDLFHQGVTGFSAYKGYYNASNQLCFTYYKDLFYTNDRRTGGPANAYNNPRDIPAIVDVDNDGDIDFLSYNVLGGFISYYKNLRVENSLPCDSIYIALKDNCWGKVYQGFYREHYLNRTCDNSSLLKPGGDAKLTHTGNTLCLFDWDWDGDYDYLDGNVSFSEMTFLKNGRIENGGNDSMVYQDTTWQAAGKQIFMPLWAAAFNIDIDQDGKKDLLIAPNTPGSSQNFHSIWFYKNYSTPRVPDWRFVSDSFLCDKTIDVGTASVPLLFDYYKDGKPDLIIGSDGFYQSSGLLKSKLTILKNTSTTGNPTFDLQTQNFLNIDSFNFRGAAPAAGDIDGDGKSDLVLGHTDGTLSYFKNMALTEGVVPDWRITQLQLTDMMGDTINVDGNAAPFIYDVDKDGKKDLVIGNNYGTIQYYRNVAATPGTLRLQLINKELGGAKVDPLQIFGSYSTPYIGRIDGSGRDYLLMGSNSGNLYLYDSIASGDTTLTYPLVSGMYSYIDSTHNRYNSPGAMYGVYSDLRNAPTIGDIDGDGTYEMLVGNVYGGIKCYRLKPYDNTQVDYESLAQNLAILPNPASDAVQIQWQNVDNANLHIAVRNIQGQEVYTHKAQSTFGQTAIDVANWPSGVYFIYFQSGTQTYHHKLSVVH